MSLYQVGMTHAARGRHMMTAHVGAEQPGKTGKGVWIALAAMTAMFIAIPGKKGWSRAMGSLSPQPPHAVIARRKTYLASRQKAFAK